jgi:hypothetical protein
MPKRSAPHARPYAATSRRGVFSERARELRSTTPGGDDRDLVPALRAYRATEPTQVVT